MIPLINIWENLLIKLRYERLTRMKSLRSKLGLVLWKFSMFIVFDAFRRIGKKSWCLAFLLIVASVVLHLNAVIYKIYNVYPAFKTTMIVIDVISHTLLTSFVLICFYVTISNEHLINLCSRKVTTADKLMDIVIYRTSECFLCHFVLIHTCFLIYCIYIVLYICMSFSSTYCYNHWLAEIQHYYSIIFVLLIRNQVELIRQRFAFFNKKLSLSIDIVIARFGDPSNKTQIQNTFLVRIDSLFLSYINLIEAIEIINKILGWPFLVLILKDFSDALRIINIVLVMVLSHLNETLVGALSLRVMYVCISWVSEDSVCK